MQLINLRIHLINEVENEINERKNWPILAFIDKKRQFIDDRMMRSNFDPVGQNNEGTEAPAEASKNKKTVHLCPPAKASNNNDTINQAAPAEASKNKKTVHLCPH